MKTKHFYKGIGLLAMALTTAACQNELKEEANELNPGEKTYMTIHATQSTTPQTRTEYEDKLGIEGTNGIVVNWENTAIEKIQIFGYPKTTGGFTELETLNSIPTSRSEDGVSITFGGIVSKADNYIAIYPMANCEHDFATDPNSIKFDFSNQVQDCAAGNQMKHLKKCDIMLGTPEAGNTNNYKFEHKATTLRFKLTLPTGVTKKIKRVTLASTKKISTGMRMQKTSSNDFSFTGYNDVNSISLDIKNHAAANILTAYMMTPPFDASNDVLTITVDVEGGTPYEGKLNVAANTKLLAGLCYTLTPTLTPGVTITVPSVEEGQLGSKLEDLPVADNISELSLTGNANSKDLESLAKFLNPTTGKGAKIATLDLSGLTLPNTGTPNAPIVTVAGFEGCTNLKDVKLPKNATVIGEAAFKGCTSLTTISQEEQPATRASVPKKMKKIGASAFEGCTAITEMLLHSQITDIGAKAFYGCSALKALVFETNNNASTINMGADILTGTHKDLVVFLPYVEYENGARSYNALFGKTYYYFPGYRQATIAEKLNTNNYKKFLNPIDGTSPVLPPGTDFGN